MYSRARAVLLRPVFGIFTLLAIAAMVGCGSYNAPTGSGCNNANGIGGFTVHISDVNANNVVVGDAAGGSAYGNFASALSGTPLQGCATSFGSSSDFLGTPYTLQYGEAPALWSGAYKAWCVNPSIAPAGLDWSTDLYVGDPINPNGGGPENMIGTCSTAAAGSFFELSSSLPSTLTISGTGLNTAYGLPRLEVSSIQLNGVESYTQATSVASSGTSATFQFPPNSSGGSSVPASTVTFYRTRRGLGSIQTLAEMRSPL